MINYNQNPIDFNPLADAINKVNNPVPGAVIPVNVPIPTTSTTANSTPSYLTPQTNIVPTVPTPGSVASITPTAPIVSTPVKTTSTKPTGTSGNIPSNFMVGGTVLNPTATPGSVASLPNAPTYSTDVTKTPQQAELDAIIAAQKTAANQTIDPNAIYQEQLLQRQRQIDNINAMYADRLNAARIAGIGRVQSRQFAQGRAGQIGSGTGEAGINAVEQMNTEQQNAIRNEQQVAIDTVLEKVKSDALAIAQQKTAAKEKGIEAYTASLKEGITKQKEATTAAIAGLVAKGIDITHMTPEQLDQLKKSSGLSELEIANEFKKQIDLNKKAQLEVSKTNADIEKLKSEAVKNTAQAEQVGKMTPYQSAQIAIDWYKAKNPNASESKTTALKTDVENAATQLQQIVEQKGFKGVDPGDYKVMADYLQKEYGISAVGSLKTALGALNLKIDTGVDSLGNPIKY